jgi:hypothetical protein
MSLLPCSSSPKGADGIGKILSDTANVDSLNIKEKDFLVVMVSKVAAICCVIRES